MPAEPTAEKHFGETAAEVARCLRDGLEEAVEALDLHRLAGEWYVGPRPVSEVVAILTATDAPARRRNLAEMVAAVEEEVGMGAGAWDTIDPQEIIGAVVRMVCRQAAPDAPDHFEAKCPRCGADLLITPDPEPEPDAPGGEREPDRSPVMEHDGAYWCIECNVYWGAISAGSGMTVVDRPCEHALRPTAPPEEP